MSLSGIFMLVSGYFRLPNDIPKPVWRYPMSYISFHFWALQGQYQNDLKGLLFDNQSPDLPKIPGEYILENIFQIDRFTQQGEEMQQKNGTQNTTVAPDGLTHSPSLRNYVADHPNKR
uniref:ABC-2 type transporter domain-containing protein n=1 Tax=Populus alba TaxID=43335 RepID=A0A4U5PYT5_POPAL|nr:hypothetical protein D5086_0000179690 [Populus alba]